MKNKELKIEVPTGYVIDKENSTFEKIIFKEVEKELPKSWEEFGKIKGWFVDNMCEIDYYSEGDSTDYRDKNLFPTEEEAEACIALAQLCQLRDRYNDGWKPNYKDNNVKYLLYYCGDTITKSHTTGASNLLVFKTEELRDKFLENFKDLIEIAKSLL